MYCLTGTRVVLFQAVRQYCVKSHANNKMGQEAGGKLAGVNSDALE